MTNQPADGERYYIGADTLQKLIDACGPFIMHDDEDTARDLRMALLELQENQSCLAAAAEQLREKDEELKRLGERLVAAEGVLHEIVCTEPPDDGVVLLTNDSPCHWDAEANIDVYDHEHFSPLGDALMKLYRMLKGTEDVPSQ